MLRRDQTRRTRGQAQHHRHIGLPTKHVAYLGHLVHYFVHGAGDEINIHDFRHWPHAAQRCPQGRPADPCLGYGGLRDTIVIFFLNGPGHVMRPPVGNDILTEDDNRLVPRHLFMESVTQGVTHADLWHGWSPSIVSMPGTPAQALHPASLAGVLRTAI